MRIFSAALLIGCAFLTAGCVSAPDATFSARNAQVDIDLHSIVRGQSNDLLSIALDLEALTLEGFASPKKLSKRLAKATLQMDQVDMNLPSLLATQDVELAELWQGVASGTTQPALLKQRTAEITAYRKALIGSLNASGSRITMTSNALAARGDLAVQSGDAHSLKQDLNAARIMIEMQL